MLTNGWGFGKDNSIENSLTDAGGWLGKKSSEVECSCQESFTQLVY